MILRKKRTNSSYVIILKEKFLKGKYRRVTT